MIHTVKGFGVVNKGEVDIFLELTCFFDDPKDVGNLISGSNLTRDQKEPGEPEPEINLLCSILSHCSCVPYLLKTSVEFFMS